MRLRHVAPYFELEARKAFRWLTGEIGRALLTPSQIIALQERYNFRFTRAQITEADGSPKKIRDVYLEVRSRCNGACDFCLASIKTDTRPDMAMSMAMYRRIVEELKVIGSDGVLSFHCMSEPLLHPQLLDFVRIASEELPTMTTRILTNGKRLTVDFARRLVDAGAGRVHVSTYLAKITDPLPKNLQSVLAEVECYQTDTDPWFPKWHWGRTYFQIERQQATAVRENLGGISPNAPQVRGRYWGFCEFPFRAAFINAQGKMAKCTWDFGFSDPVGDLEDGSINEQWRNGPLKEIRRQLNRGSRAGLPHCDTCNFSGGCRRNTNRTIKQRIAAHLVPSS